MRKYDSDIPIGVLIYYNLILAHGAERFFKDAAKAGVDGVLVADLPIDSADEIAPYAEANGIEQIFLVSPVTEAKRLDLITSKAAGFIYLLSRLGVTGVGQRSDETDRSGRDCQPDQGPYRCAYHGRIWYLQRRQCQSYV